MTAQVATHAAKLAAAVLALRQNMMMTCNLNAVSVSAPARTEPTNMPGRETRPMTLMLEIMGRRAKRKEEVARGRQASYREAPWER